MVNTYKIIVYSRVDIYELILILSNKMNLISMASLLITLSCFYRNECILAVFQLISHQPSDSERITL